MYIYFHDDVCEHKEHFTSDVTQHADRDAFRKWTVFINLGQCGVVLFF